MKHLTSLSILLFLFNFTNAQLCPIVIFEDVSGLPGDTVSVSMYLDDMPSLEGIQGTITYDPLVLLFVDIKKGEGLDEFFDLGGNEPFSGSGQIVISGFQINSIAHNDFIKPTEVVKIFFVLKGQPETSSQINFDNSVIGIELISSNGIVGPCDIINGSVSISNNPPDPNDFEVSLGINNSLCNQTQLGSIIATGFFGTPPYSFSWTGPNNFFSMGETIENLLPGLYNLTATDADNNTQVLSNIEILEQGGDFEAVATIQQNYCDEGQAGFININTTMNETGSPLSFLWNNGANTEDLFDLSNGIYILTITDFVGCTQIKEFEINSSRAFQVAFETNMPCENDTNGSITTDIISGDFDLVWSNGAVTPSLENIGQGTYQVTITEVQGCQQVRTVELTEIIENSTLEINTTCSSLGFDNGRAIPNFEGDLENTLLSMIDFRDSLGNEISPFDDLAIGVYSLSVTSENGCKYFAEAVIEESLSNFRENYFSCDLDSIQIETASNNPDLLYSWSQGESFSSDSIANPIFLDTDLMSGTVTPILTTTALQGCTRKFAIAINQSDNCVWPGDTNEDQIVSAQDLLFIGLVNGDTGPARLMPNVTEWFTQPSILWEENIGNTIFDKMFADCNGDGVIDANDILVIEQNEGLTHLSFTSEEELQRNIGIPLFVDLEPSYIGGATHDINIVLGDVDDPAVNAYGVAFQIKYDPNISSVQAESFIEQGWMSEDGSALWDIEFLEDGLGLVDVAITRTNGLGINGDGAIATFKTTFIANKKSEIEFEIINAVLITNTGEEMQIDNLRTTSVIGTNNTSSIQAGFFNESISPNPTSSFVHVRSDRKIEHYHIYNALGQRVISNRAFQNKIDVSSLISGLYFIHFEGPDGVTSHKLMVE